MPQNPTLKPGWPKWAKAFLRSLGLTGNVTRAATDAKIDRTVPYDLRDSDPDFAAAWASALEAAADLLEEEARRRAYDGVEKPVVHQGKVVTYWADKSGRPVSPRTKGARQIPLVVRQYSDQLLVTLLKACRPAKFRERHEITGPNGGPLQAHHTLDLTQLSDAELDTLDQLIERATPAEPPADPGGEGPSSTG